VGSLHPAVVHANLSGPALRVRHPICAQMLIATIAHRRSVGTARHARACALLRGQVQLALPQTSVLMQPTAMTMQAALWVIDPCAPAPANLSGQIRLAVRPTSALMPRTAALTRL
jgi:hypothetical protein